MSRLRQLLTYAFLALLPVMYVLFLQADSVGGLFGILWSDEGLYLLPAKHAAVFGQPHLFPDDNYMPEYTVPLIHRLGLLTMSAENPVWGIRFTVALLVLAAHALLARLAYRYHGNNRSAARWAWAMLLLCPLLFFYARVGLSEGVQYFLLALGITGIWNIQQNTSDRATILWTMAVAAIIPLLLLSKISSISAVIGLGIGLSMTLFQQFPFRKAARISLIGDMVVCAMLAAIYFGWIHGHEHIWWYNNIANPVFAENMPLNAAYAWFRLKVHAVGLNHFLTLMPIFALGFGAFVMAAQRNRGFVWTLWLMTAVMLTIEFFFGGELRRSFFGFSMLMVLAAFTVPEWLRSGINWQRPWSRSRWYAVALIVPFFIGAISFCYNGILVGDPVYQIMAPIYIAVLLAVFFLHGERMRRARVMLLAALMLMSFLPMLWQTMLGPRTIQTVIAALEKEIGPDEAVSSPVLPWSFLGLKRKVYFTSCPPANLYIGNPADAVPYQDTKYFLGISQVVKMPECVPPDFDRYERVMEFRIFYPFNKGPGYGGSRKWLWQRGFTLYRKQD